MKVKKKYVCLLIILSIVVVLVYIFYSICAYTSNAYIRANWVEISPHIKGHAYKIYVRNNQFVNKGDKLFELDRLPYLLKVNKLKAQLETNKAEANTIKENIQKTKNEITILEKQVKLKDKMRDRYEILSRDHAESIQKYQEILVAYNAMNDQLTELEGSLNVLESTLVKQIAIQKKTLAELDYNKYLYELSLIKAPFPGYVTNMYLMPGQFLHQGQSIFGIAQTQACWVEANFKECWVGKIKPGQTVWIVSDLYPFRFFKGKVESITNAVNRTVTKDKVLPYIKPTIDWVRLQYRFTVVIKIESLPKDTHLRMGADARVLVWL
jgi:membrane fusion protein, multidrug efflux system